MQWNRERITVGETDVDQRKLVEVERDAEVVDGTSIAIYAETPPRRTSGKQWVLVRPGVGSGRRVITYPLKRDARAAAEALAAEADDPHAIPYAEAVRILSRHGMYR